MVIMALDHTRDYFHSSAYIFDPSDPTLSSLPLFFTRWITHFCAPIFCFLAGLSAFLVGRRKTLAQLSTFLLKRGIWLIFIEVTIVNFAWYFDLQMRTNGFSIIAALGFGMIVLAGLIHLPRTFVFIFSCVLIFGHNLLDTVHFPDSNLWSFIHEANVLVFENSYKFYLDYPVIPWLAVMSLGYSIGPLYDQSYDVAKRKRILRMIGLLSIVLFVILRFTNLYGDSIPWVSMDSASKSLMSFFQLSKYPPSLLYLLMTLGGGALFLSSSEQLKGKAIRVLQTFGKVPFFYYIIHLYLIHLLAMFFAEFSGYDWQLFILEDWITSSIDMKGYGFSLWLVYAVWIGVVVLLYPLCHKFETYKSANKDKWWLSYL